jgi:hypothetical protein
MRAGVHANIGDVTAGDWRELRLKRDGACSGVVDGQGRPEQGAGITPAAPTVSGTAGASAMAEYERRSARREQRIRDKHPVLGGLVLALSDEPQHVRAWKTGAVGERAVGRRLDGLVADGVEVMHDRRIPGTRANIDHVAVSSSGVYVIDAKHYTGMVKVDWEGGLFSPRRYRLRVGRRDCTKLVSGLERQVELVRTALARHSGLAAGVPVVGVLAFFEAEWPVLFPPDKINEVRLGGPRGVCRLIRRPGPLTAERIAGIADRLRDAFPDATPGIATPVQPGV